jgi:hypothetical protein
VVKKAGRKNLVLELYPISLMMIFFYYYSLTSFQRDMRDIRRSGLFTQPPLNVPDQNTQI